jgi:exodeoxyribonuclease V alpha subunit
VTDVPLPFPPPAPPPEVGARAVARRLAHTDRDDLHAGDRVERPPAPLAAFVAAGVLGAADVHTAAALARLTGDTRDEVLLAAALAVRAPRRQHVCVELPAVRDRVVSELAEEARHLAPVEGAPAIGDLPWPDPDAWRAVLADDGPAIAVRDPATLDEPDDAGTDVRPLTLAGDRLYLDRYWRAERRLARALHDRAARPVDGVDPVWLRGELDALAGLDPPDRQRVAVASAVTRHLTVVAGGPGTGKTTTVARMLRLLDRGSGDRPLAVALAAPTGKAAARLTESLRSAAAADELWLQEATATTLHRLLGATGGRRFRHGRDHPLPHDVVVVDETSMVDLPMLARLFDAVRPDARVVLLGDPHQLASVEAGSVLADVVGDPDGAPVRSADARERLRAAVGDAHVSDTAEVASSGVHDALVVLDRVHRFRAGSGLDRFATAIRTGDADAAIALLRDAEDLHWLPPSADDAAAGGAQRHGPSDRTLAPVRERVVSVGRTLHDAAAAGEGAAALAALDELRVLCAHRRGEPGVAGWTARIEAWLADALGVDVDERWYVGRPVLFTANDRRLQLWNGDLGVVVADDDGGVAVAFPAADGAGTRRFAPDRLAEVDTVHAMTVHRSQGSQVRHAVVVLPDPASRICTRELLYTAVTRAQDGATIVGSEGALRATIAARTQRASGLGAALGR